ncbi:hypothetical protein ACFV5G_12405 [Streptomyces sp. NPDC059766]|uniref:hypothetical protein n=1 Tax=Streptomyces sp. NPDC059766 TaxID=3346940 RepID=UPI00365DEB60
MSMVSGSAVVTALTVANAPWKVVVLTVCATLVVSLVLGLAKMVLPEESEHKLNLLLVFIHDLERRAQTVRALTWVRKSSAAGRRKVTARFRDRCRTSAPAPDRSARRTLP